MDNDKIDDFINKILSERNDVWNRNTFNNDCEVDEKKLAYHQGHSEGMTKAVEILAKGKYRGLNDNT